MPRSGMFNRETKQAFRIQTEMKSNSSNIIYMIECAFCGIQYIGEKTILRHRFDSHRKDILHERNREVLLYISTKISVNQMIAKLAPFPNGPNWHQTN